MCDLTILRLLDRGLEPGKASPLWSGHKVQLDSCWLLPRCKGHFCIFGGILSCCLFLWFIWHLKFTPQDRAKGRESSVPRCRKIVSHPSTPAELVTVKHSAVTNIVKLVCHLTPKYSPTQRKTFVNIYKPKVENPPQPWTVRPWDGEALGR